MTKYYSMGIVYVCDECKEERSAESDRFTNDEKTFVCGACVKTLEAKEEQLEFDFMKEGS